MNLNPVNLSAACAVCLFRASGETAWLDAVIHTALTEHDVSVLPARRGAAPPWYRGHLRLVAE